MKRKISGYCLMMMAVLGIAACQDKLDNTDEDQLTKNEESIQNYLTANNLSATRDTSGLYFVKKETNPQGVKPNLGDEVSVYYQMYTLDGTLIDSTETVAKKPLKFPLGVNYLLPGMERGISLMRTGEKMTVLLPFYLAFGNVGYQKVPAYSPIRVEMQLADVRTEARQIADYIKNKDYFVSETTPSGITIVRQNTVAGDTLGKGKSVSVTYVGKNLAGTQFDSGTFQFVTGTGAAVKGFDEGVRRLHKGEKAILIFPSSLGYGAAGAKNQQTGAYVVLPYAPLAFEVEVTQ
ncbi:FKBP-type peptidyl-prolyl cis-trans isomerase [Salmonirosea aquatica]|uniref:Peptidyl-prolyl cis-trans isomerase n=1 Tax=Salmonirosea aquatica TaxID=2654236 RepID=A0A7C9BG07_9BACT|nr:FKBP-type peptidyl-prolyl cis-trans isomerase [Cytophagaceae bacterium SJW1-29]